MRIKLISYGMAMVLLLSGCSTAQYNQTENKTDSSAETKPVELSYRIPDTGVTDFYSNTDIIDEPSVGEPFYGQDATYQFNTPSYTDNNDGTITDNVTGLMWQKDMGEKMTYEEALEAAENCTLGGYDDWRIPTIKELYSLILYTGRSGGEKAGEQQFIDTNYFIQPLGDTEKGEREIDAQTWSSTIYTGKTMNNAETVFGVNFVDGRIKGYPLKKQNKENKMYFRFVRGNPEYGINQFVDNGDGTVTDLATGLMWQKADSGMGMDWQDALEYAENLELAGYSDWRLPNAKELQSIVDYSRSPMATDSAAIDPIFEISEIQDMDGQKQYPYFWSSTTHLDGANPYSSAVYIAFGEAQGIMNGKLMDVHGAGAQRSDPKSGKPEDYPSAFGPQGDIRMVYNYVRCVRNVDSVSSQMTNSDSYEGKEDDISDMESDEFSFAIQADVHIDEETNSDILKETINNIVSVSPSFIMDLGDTLMLGKYGESKTEALERLKLVDSYFSTLKDIPICLINGNHDGENGFRPKLMKQSQELRNEYYAMPFQNLSSFSGNVTTANYYSFEKGNVLFVALDPFTFTEDPSAGWEDTLGIEQYNWLEDVLSQSEASFKFIFIHNLLGGIDEEHRGGAAAASLYEWGGNNEDGEYEFLTQRPDFEMPIHELLQKYDVTAVFHGHDHFYAREEKDGIQYILVPQPGTSRPKVTTADEKGYSEGIILPSAGFLNVTASKNSVKIEYCKTLPKGGYTVKDTVTLQEKEV